ncbi:glycosyltransferase [Reichenbachiella versicolor]|uniref:glycosyltransferase n=1 Tax=Reichenbachiella versicolor TaxID=1821036 RepID=UPI000D6E3F85|nr:glycosyltransferase [Reichenbachiella versicolor]
MPTSIIIHSLPAWDSPYIKSTVELAKNMDQDALFIDYAYTWIDVLKTKHAPNSRILGLRSRTRKEKGHYGNTITILNQPAIIPTNKIKWNWLRFRVHRLNVQKLNRFYRKWKQKLCVDRPVVINAQNPVQGIHTDYEASFSPSKIVYYSYDNIEAMKWLSKQGKEAEARFIKRANQVICTSKGLADKFSSMHQDVKVVHNGVNDTVFCRQETTPKNYIDYLGAVDDRLDLDLVKNLISKFQDYTFRFIGPVKYNKLAKVVNKSENGRMTGAMGQTEAVDLLAEAKACIIPFKSNDFTKFVYPLKINEYLSMGKPVVTTNFADLSSFTEIVSIAQSADEFLEMLSQELDSDNTDKQQQREFFAKQNNWRSRALQFEFLVGDS